MKQPYEGKYWDETFRRCLRHVAYTIYNVHPYCLLCKISELRNQRDMAREEIGLLQGMLEDKEVDM